MELSVVTTMYHSATYLPEFYRRVCETAESLYTNFEIIFVNDGSPDNSREVIRDLQKSDSRVKLVDLSRNFGHHFAIMAGIQAAKGNEVFLIDCDLEEQPEWLIQFKEIRQRSKSDVTFGVQKQRVQSFHSNLFGNIFWKTLNYMSKVRIEPNPMTCRLMSREYVDALLQIEDKVLYLGGVFSWAGFKQTPVPFLKKPRAQRSTYSFTKKLMQVVDSFSSFSTLPLTLIFLFGLTLWGGSIIFTLGLLAYKLINPALVMSGFTSIMLSIWFLGGTIILGLGILGLYLGKIFEEVKVRPRFIIRQNSTGGDRD